MSAPAATPDLGFTPKGLLIGGTWRDSASGKTFETINPSNREPLGELPHADDRDVDRAVRAAKQAFSDWRRVPAKERAGLLRRLAERMRAERAALALIDCVDSGNALQGMIGDVEWSADTYDYFAGLISEIKGESASYFPRHLNLTRRQPYGVVVKINPFNHPFRFCAEKSAAALAAGNTVVLKAAEQAPLSSLRFAELCEEVLPPGVVNVLTGDAATGRAMVRHPEVSRIGVVGSVATGQAILRDAGLKHVSLELGGKNPIIIFPDAEPRAAALAAIKGMNMNRQGQSCSSTSRVLVHESLHRPLADELVRLAEALPMGPPWLDGNEVGPVISERHYERILDFIASARREGAVLLSGGEAPIEGALAQGFFVPPTIFDRVRPDMRIAREEIFGPVMSIMPWADYEDMIAVANGLDYGLTAAIVTNDLARAMETAERIEAGYVWINSGGRYLGAPYGGWKSSGLGQEECFDELLSYTRVKNINLRW